MATPRAVNSHPRNWSLLWHKGASPPLPILITNQFPLKGTRELFNGYKAEKQIKASLTLARCKSLWWNLFMWRPKLWFVNGFCPSVNGMRPPWIIRNQIIITETVDWTTGILDELWFVAYLWHIEHKSYLKARVRVNLRCPRRTSP